MPFDIAEAFILATEQALGASLPPAYRAFMRASNGGGIEADDDVWTLFPMEDTSDRKRASRTANHLVKETGTYLGWRHFPKEALAIAGNGTGDVLVFLKQGGAYQPGIYRWAHETGALSKIADDFSQLKHAL